MMKNIISFGRLWHILMSVLIGSNLIWVYSCKNDKEEMKWVDLRYSAQDEYNIPALDPESIVIQVKSTEPWDVYSQHSDWCTIEPGTGEDVTKIYNVTIRYKDNNNLDDRVDTIIVKSDYWIGKWITVCQKGTAYLTLSDHEDILLSKDKDSSTFNVLSNQDWTAVVTDGANWLSITSGESGSLNGSVTVTSTQNKGAKRYGTVTIYDRHGVEAATIGITQDGVQLDPAEDIIHSEYRAYEYVLPIVSNSEWTVTKDDDEIDWYSFEQTEFEGNTELKIKLEENKGSTIRQASFTIATKQVEGVESVKKTIVVKQAFNPIPSIYEFDEGEVGKWTPNGTAPVIVNGNDISFAANNGNSRMYRGNFVPGYYEFRIKSMTPTAHSIIFVTYNEKEIRYHMNASGKQTDISTTPWSDLKQVPFDPTVPHTLGVNITKGDNGMSDFDWTLDGVTIASVKNFADFTTPATIYVGANQTGTVVYDWWSYTAPLDWGE